MLVDARHVDCVPALSDIVRSKVAYIQGRVGDHQLNILLDSGASCSVIHREYVAPQDLYPPCNITLTNADGRELAPLGTTTLRVNLGNLEADQSFTVVENLSAPAILGCDFLKRVVDFQKNVVSSCLFLTLQAQLNLHQASVCTLVLDNDYPQAIPYPATTSKPELDMPIDYHPSLYRNAAEGTQHNILQDTRKDHGCRTHH